MKTVLMTLAVIPNFKNMKTALPNVKLSVVFLALTCLFVSPVVKSAAKLYSFGAALSYNNKVDLQWVTASEIGATQFIVEISTDGANFKEIAVVFSVGNTITKTYYNYSDKLDPSASGIFYYRLRSVEDDGNVQFSATRVIRVDKQAGKNISILAYPNPVTNELRITVPDNWQNKKLTYEIFRANGLSISKVVCMNSSQTETINVSSLVPGLYFIRVSGEGASIQQKIVKFSNTFK